MRRTVIAISVVVVVVILALIAGATLLNVNRYKPRIESELQKKLGRPVTLGQLHLHLFPFSIKADGITIGEPPGFPSTPPFATAQDLYVSADLGPLISGQPEIKDVTLNNAQVELIRDPAGAWNFSNLGAGGSGSSSGSGSKKDFTLNKLSITNAQLAITDLKARSPRTVYNHIDLNLENFGSGKEFTFDASVHFPGTGKELLDFRGKAGPLSSGGAAATPISGHISLEQVSLRSVNSFAQNTIPPNTDAEASGEADVSNQGSSIACKGSLTLANAVFRGARLNYPVNAQYDVSLNEAADQINLRSTNIKVGPTALALSGTVDSAKAPSTLNLRAITNNASITELSRLAGLFGIAFNANDQVKGSLSADLNITGPANSPQIQGNLSSNSLQAQSIVLTDVHATGSVKDGVVNLAPLTSNLFGGHEEGTLTLDTRPAHPVCALKAHVTGVDTNALLSAFSSAKDTLYGSLAANGDLHFALDSGPNLAQSLNGTVNFAVSNGHLKNVNILNELSRVGQFLHPAPTQNTNGTNLQKLSASMNITSGVAITNDLVAVMNEGSLSGKGSLNLVNQGIFMHVTAVLGNSVSKAVGGNGIGGFLNTVLANNKGELVLPVLVKGTMAHPVFSPDLQSLGQLKASRLLPTVGDPSKLASGLVGSVLGGALGQPAQSGQKNKQPQPQDAIQSLFNQFGRKKK